MNNSFYSQSLGSNIGATSNLARPGAYLVSPSFGKTGASETYSKISRAMWQDYLDRFSMYEDQLRDQINNDQLLSDQVARNVAYSNQANDTARRDAVNRMRSYGVQLSPSQNLKFNKRFNLQKSLGEIDAKNFTRLAKSERDMGALIGQAQSSGALRENGNV